MPSWMSSCCVHTTSPRGVCRRRVPSADTGTSIPPIMLGPREDGLRCGGLWWSVMGILSWLVVETRVANNGAWTILSLPPLLLPLLGCTSPPFSTPNHHWYQISPTIITITTTTTITYHHHHDLPSPPPSTPSRLQGYGMPVKACCEGDAATPTSILATITSGQRDGDGGGGHVPRGPHGCAQRHPSHVAPTPFVCVSPPLIMDGDGYGRIAHGRSHGHGRLE